MTTEQRYGWYSATQEEYHGSMLYTTPEGGEARVTAVGGSATVPPIAWPDRVLVGPVVRWVKTLPPTDRFSAYMADALRQQKR